MAGLSVSSDWTPGGDLLRREVRPDAAAEPRGQVVADRVHPAPGQREVVARAAVRVERDPHGHATAETRLGVRVAVGPLPRAEELRATLPEAIGRWSPLARDQYVEAHTLMSGYLLSSQGDRMAMAASIEARFPFLDHRVIEFANRLPPQYKLRGLAEKHILKKSMAAELPPAITRRSKQPYRAPDSASFFVDGKPLDYVAELLSPKAIDDAGVFDAASVGRLMEKCRSGRAVGFGDNIAFVGVLSTMLLHRQFIAPAGGPCAIGP